MALLERDDTLLLTEDNDPCVAVDEPLDIEVPWLGVVYLLVVF